MVERIYNNWMQFSVVNIVHHAQIFYAIVRMCPIDMINLFVWL